MNFYKAILAWLVIGILLGVGLWLFVAKGTFIMLAVVLIGFIVAVGKIGCSAH
jgi:hypothetical protein